MRAAGDGGALPRAVARRAGGVRRRVLVPRAHQAQPAAAGAPVTHACRPEPVWTLVASLCEYPEDTGSW